MNKQEFLGASLCTGLHCEKYGLIIGVYNLSGWCIKYMDGSFARNATLSCVTPIARPLSDLTKPITHNCETFIPIVELAKMCKVNLKLTGEWIVDESLAQNCVRIQDNYFWYNGDSFLYSILAKTECKMIVHNQQELLFQLIEWHFNLMDESEPFIPVTNEFNPYK